MTRHTNACLCSAILPPVPEPAIDNCVPLAVVTIRRRDCRVIDICNTSARKFAITFSNLAYWLSPLEDTFNNLRQHLSKLCCTRSRYDRAVPIQFAEIRHEEVLRRADPRAEAAAVGPRFRQAWAKRTTAFDPRALILDSMGLAQSTGEPYLSPIERSDPLVSLLLDKLVVPFISNLTEMGLSGPSVSAGQPVAERAQPAAQPSAEEISSLRSRLDELAALVAKQEAQIADLRKNRRRNRGAGTGNEVRQ
jgi:hypothetical protein